MRRLGLAALVAAGPFAVGGCKTPDPTPAPRDVAASWSSSRPTRLPVRRVLVPPFQDLTGHPGEVARIRDSMVDALARRGRFELVPVQAHELRDEIPASVFEAGAVPRRALLAAARRYRADAVLFGAVTRYRPYEPLLVALQVELVTADDGRSDWSASGTFDAATQDVVADVRNYHDVTLAATSSLEGWRLLLLSPSRFVDYACARLAEKLP